MCYGAGGLTANSPIAVSCWRDRLSLNIMVKKPECLVIAERLREGMSRAGLLASHSVALVAGINPGPVPSSTPADPHDPQSVETEQGAEGNDLGKGAGPGTDMEGSRTRRERECDGDSSADPGEHEREKKLKADHTC